MTSTRRTIPAPPPNGVSSPWPRLSGVCSRRSSVRSSCPAASAFVTWRWERNQSNQSGNRVTTSSRSRSPPRGLAPLRRVAVRDGDAEEVGIDDDPAVGQRDLEHGVGDERDEELTHLQ